MGYVSAKVALVILFVLLGLMTSSATNYVIATDENDNNEGRQSSPLNT
jgi:hypothetical protein